MSYAKRNSIENLQKRHLDDPVFEAFGFTGISFARKRWAAGFANSCATNLGRFMDKAAKEVLAHAFNVERSIILKKVEINVDGNLVLEETDGVVLAHEVSPQMREIVRCITDKYANEYAKRLHPPFSAKGVGFEFRGRYGKNDDTLIQKDEHMAAAIRQLHAVPVLAIFSTRNADGAIKRLDKSWVVTTGSETIDIVNELSGVNLMEYLNSRSSILSPVIDLIKDEAPSAEEIAQAVEATEDSLGQIKTSKQSRSKPKRK